MKGTEKQIAWATDIINAPINTIKAYAEKRAESRITSDRDTAEALVKAIDTYHSMISSAPQCEDAGFVIANRGKFSAIAKEAVRRTLIENGIHPAATLMDMRI